MKDGLIFDASSIESALWQEYLPILQGQEADRQGIGRTLPGGDFK